MCYYSELTTLSFQEEITTLKNLMQFAENRERMQMVMLRNTQGLHVP
jgi:hypothetical protein